MYKKDLSLNKLQLLVCNKTKPNQTKPNQIKPNLFQENHLFKVKSFKFSF